MIRKLLLLLVLIQPGGISFAQEESHLLQAKLQTTLDNYTLNEDTFLQALTKVAGQFELPMGIVWIKNQKTSPRINRRWTHVTLYQVMKTLVGSQPGYDFEVKNGVVRVFPHGDLEDKKSFLNIKIDEFEVKNEVAGWTNHRLHVLVKRIVSPPPPSPPGAGEAWSFGSNADDRPVSFTLKNVTVRDVLDRLTLSSASKIWIVMYSEDSRLTKTGFHRTASLFSNTPIPEDNQPVWAVLRWGFIPPQQP